jgi:hypothetical protein
MIVGMMINLIRKLIFFAAGSGGEGDPKVQRYLWCVYDKKKLLDGSLLDFRLLPLLSRTNDTKPCSVFAFAPSPFFSFLISFILGRLFLYPNTHVARSFEPFQKCQTIFQYANLLTCAQGYKEYQDLFTGYSRGFMPSYVIKHID